MRSWEVGAAVGEVGNEDRIGNVEGGRLFANQAFTVVGGADQWMGPRCPGCAYPVADHAVHARAAGVGELPTNRSGLPNQKGEGGVR